MQNTYAQKQKTAQKKDAHSAASIHDASSQSEALQRKADMANNAVQRAEAPRPNNTGMPDNLKAGIESLSGFSMDDVRVHYNSSKPATVQALAYTQGTDIHVAPGQEKHLPHEAWHVAQQMAGRVSPTTNINGMPVNDNAGLEHEADVMGEKAVQRKKVIQREVPKDPKSSPPIPETGRYRAIKGRDKIYDPSTHTRDKFSFGKHTREDVFEKRQHVRIGNEIVAIIDDGSCQMVSVTGIQLDHIHSWENISNCMYEHNFLKYYDDRYRNDDSFRYYNFWDAKMYYNDITNLHPVSGSFNAAAGINGVPEPIKRNEVVDSLLVQIQASWMNLQNFITAYYEEDDLNEEKLTKLYNYLQNLKVYMDSFDPYML